jgi:predicted RNA-binding protein with PIN domain
MVANIDEAIEQARSKSLEVIANYTAFQQIRATLGRVG